MTCFTLCASYTNKASFSSISCIMSSLVNDPIPQTTRVITFSSIYKPASNKGKLSTNQLLTRGSFLWVVLFLSGSLTHLLKGLPRARLQ